MPVSVLPRLSVETSFVDGKSLLTPAFLAELRRFADVARAGKVTNVRIVGYSPWNRRLANARAVETRNALRKLLGDSVRYEVRGEIDRSFERRVEVSFG